MPEQAQGASRLLQLSNSSSWQILQCDIALFDCNSSTNKTTSPILPFCASVFQKALFLLFKACFLSFFLALMTGFKHTKWTWNSENTPPQYLNWKFIYKEKYLNWKFHYFFIIFFFELFFIFGRTRIGRLSCTKKIRGLGSSKLKCLTCPVYEHNDLW